eukprot:gene19703-26394_t
MIKGAGGCSYMFSVDPVSCELQLYKVAVDPVTMEETSTLLQGVDGDKLLATVKSLLPENPNDDDYVNGVINTCSSKLADHPDYDVITKHLFLTNLYKSTPSTFSEAVEILHNNEILSDELKETVMSNKTILDAAIDNSRDYGLTYFGLKTMYSTYLSRHVQPKNAVGYIKVASLASAVLLKKISERDVKARLEKYKRWSKIMKDLQSIPHIEQRSEEWYQMRWSLITASDLAQCLGDGKFGTQDDFFMKKCDEATSRSALPNEAPLIWGIKDIHCQSHAELVAWKNQQAVVKGAKTTYWYLDIMSIQRVYREKTFIDAKYNAASIVWQKVLKFREELQDGHVDEADAEAIDPTCVLESD